MGSADDASLVIAIHTSDRLSFKRCRRRWDVLSDIRRGLKPYEAPRPLDFGTALHKAMEVFYDPETWDLTLDEATRPLIVENAVKAFVDSMASIKARYLRLSGKEGLEPEQREEYEEDLDLGTGMLRHYFQYVWERKLDRFTPIATEVDFEIDIFTPEEIVEYFPHLPEGTRIVYRGRIDQIVKDMLGQIWQWDHKTTARMRDQQGHLELDEQMGSYNWAMWRLGIQVTGIISAEIYKNYEFFPINYVAYDMMTGKSDFADRYSRKDQSDFETYLNAQVANLTEMATVGKNHIASLRENAVGTYKKLMGENADETIVTMLNAETTGITTLISLTKDYQARLEEKFPLTCAKCGSKDVNRASSVSETEEEGKTGTEDTTKNQEPSSTGSVLDSLYKKKIK